MPPCTHAPLMIAPIACSRMPNGTLRPPWTFANSPPPSKTVLVDSTRSAAPPIIVGANSENAAIVFCPAARVASCSPGEKLGSAARQPSRSSPVQARSQSAACPGRGSPPAPGLPGQRLAPGRGALLPLLLGAAALLAQGHVLVHALVDPEGAIGVKAHYFLGGAHLGLAQRRAVRLGGDDRVRRRERYVRADRDERRALDFRARGAHRLVQRAQVLGVGYALHVPAVGGEALDVALAVERQRGGAVDRNAVVVVADDQLAEAEVARDRRGLLADALHHVAV